MGTRMSVAQQDEKELDRALELLSTPALFKSWLSEQPEEITYKYWYDLLSRFLVHSRIYRPIIVGCNPGKLRLHFTDAEPKDIPVWCWNITRELPSDTTISVRQVLLLLERSSPDYEAGYAAATEVKETSIPENASDEWHLGWHEGCRDEVLGLGGLINNDLPTKTSFSAYWFL